MDDQLREKLLFEIKIMYMFTKLRNCRKPVHNRKRSADASAETAGRFDIGDLLDVISVDLL